MGQASVAGRRKRLWAWIGGLALGTVFVVLALRGVDWGRAAAALERASPAWLLAAAAANFLMLPLGTWQWRWLLPRGRHVGFRTMFWIRSVTSTVANGGPFLGGYAATVHLLATRGGVGYEVGVSLKAVEQVAEGVAKLAVVAAAVAAAPLPPSFRAGVGVLVVAVPALAAGLLVGASRAGALRKRASAGGGRRGRILAFAARVAEGLEVIRRPAALGSGVGLAVAQKIAEGAAIWAVAASLGIPLDLPGLLLVLAAVNLSTMISLTPANVGIYEGSAFLAYRFVGVDPATAVGVSVLQHVAYLVPMAGTGWLLLAVEGVGLDELTGGSPEAGGGGRSPRG